MKIFSAIESLKGILETGSCRVGTLTINEEVSREYYRPVYLDQQYRYEDIDIGFDIFENIEKPKVLLLRVTFSS